MKKLIVLTGVLALLSFTYLVKNKQVSGKMLQTNSYCGGAALAPDEMAEVEKPRPLAGKKCYVREGNKNNIKGRIVASFESDSSGNFMIYLAPGEYCIIDSRKYDKNFVADIAKKYKKGDSNYTAADMDCLKKWLSTPDLVFTVKEDGENKITVTYNNPCSWAAIPCVQYSGPLPP